jgi:hypothetical protein
MSAIVRESTRSDRAQPACEQAGPSNLNGRSDFADAAVNASIVVTECISLCSL